MGTTGVIMGLCAIIMVLIGIRQIKSKKPVGFYSGVKAPDEEEISDVKAWNRKHGAMGILYGISIELAFLCGLFIGNSILLLIPFSIGLLLPIPLMVMYHHHLVKKYYNK